MISKEHLNKINELKETVKNAVQEAEAQTSKARETQLLARIADLEYGKFIQQIYIEYKLPLTARINNETGSVIKDDEDHEPDTEPPSSVNLLNSEEQLDFFTEKAELTPKYTK